MIAHSSPRGHPPVKMKLNVDDNIQQTVCNLRDELTLKQGDFCSLLSQIELIPPRNQCHSNIVPS